VCILLLEASKPCVTLADTCEKHRWIVGWAYSSDVNEEVSHLLIHWIRHCWKSKLISLWCNILEDQFFACIKTLHRRIEKAGVAKVFQAIRAHKKLEELLICDVTLPLRFQFLYVDCRFGSLLRINTNHAGFHWDYTTRGDRYIGSINARFLLLFRHLSAFLDYFVYQSLLVVYIAVSTHLVICQMPIEIGEEDLLDLINEFQQEICLSVSVDIFGALWSFNWIRWGKHLSKVFITAVTPYG